VICPECEGVGEIAKELQQHGCCSPKIFLVILECNNRVIIVKIANCGIFYKYHKIINKRIKRRSVSIYESNFYSKCT